MVIEPTMIYGHKAAALSKANRAANCAGTKPNKRKVHYVLEGKFITKRIKYLRLLL